MPALPIDDEEWKLRQLICEAIRDAVAELLDKQLKPFDLDPMDFQILLYPRDFFEAGGLIHIAGSGNPHNPKLATMLHGIADTLQTLARNKPTH